MTPSSSSTAASSSMLWTALTPSSQSIVAVVDPSSIGSGGSRRVVLFQTDKSSHGTKGAAHMLMSLTHRPKQEGLSDDSELIKALFFVNDSMLCLVTAQEFVVWDVTRGVPSFTIAAEAGQAFLHGSSAGNDDDNSQALLLVQTSESSLKCQVHLYDTNTRKLVRKVKVGKAALSVGAAPSGSMLVRSKDSVKLVASDTGSRLQKFEELSEHAGLATAGQVAMTVSNGQLLVMKLRDGSSRSMEMPAQKSQSTSVMQLIALEDDDSENGCLLWHSTGLYKLGADKEALQLACSLTVDPTMQHWSLCLGSDQVVAVVRHDGSKEFRVLVKPLEGIVTADAKASTTWDLSRPAAEASAENDASNSAPKRKQESSVLGPGQAGGEARGVSELASKRSKLENDDDVEMDEADGEEGDEDDNGPTVAERLAQLQKILDEESELEEDSDEADKDAAKLSFNSKRATTESLSQLLQQALQSGDDQMLELALQVRDKKVIEESCLAITSDQAALLLAALTTRLAIKPGRADHLCVWLSILLQTNKIKSVAHLQPLQNLLEERVEVFSALLKLDGRLSMMGSKYK